MCRARGAGEPGSRDGSGHHAWNRAGDPRGSTRGGAADRAPARSDRATPDASERSRAAAVVSRPVAAPLVGYRCWLAEDLEGCERSGAPAPVLRSVSFHATDWAAGRVTAVCHTWWGAWSALTHGPLPFRR